jgi:hypothetical protein
LPTLCFDSLTDEETGALIEALFAFANISQAFFSARAEPLPGGIRQVVTFDSPAVAGRFAEFLGSRVHGLAART